MPQLIKQSVQPKPGEVVEQKAPQFYPKWVGHPQTGKPVLCADHIAHGRLIGKTVRPDTSIEEEPEPYDLSKMGGPSTGSQVGGTQNSSETVKLDLSKETTE